MGGPVRRQDLQSNDCHKDAMQIYANKFLIPKIMTEITENVVHNCDFMKNRLPDHCADLIIADPPYFQYKGDFDFVWPTFDDYLNDVRRWGEECRRFIEKQRYADMVGQ